MYLFLGGVMNGDLQDKTQEAGEYQLKTKIVRERRKNGDIYVRERTVRYNPAKKCDDVLSTRLLGKIPKGKKDMEETRPRRCHQDVVDEHIRQHVGLTGLLKWAETESGIKDDLEKACMGESGLASKIRSLAWFLTACKGQRLPAIVNWQVMHPIPYSFGISEDIYHDVFTLLGHREDIIQRYFSLRSRKVGEQSAIAYDSTTISTYSSNQIEARYGYNKAGDGLKTIKLVTLMSMEENQPIAFVKQPGNIPDVISIKNALKELEFLNIKNNIVVSDNGYYSAKNISNFFDSGMKFLVRIGIYNSKWVRDIIDEQYEEFSKFCNKCPFDNNIYIIKKSVSHDFSYMAQDVSRKIPSQHVVYLYVFRNNELINDNRKMLTDRLEEVKKQIESGNTEFTISGTRFENRFFEVSNSEEGNVVATVKEDAFLEAQKYFGFFAVISNEELNKNEALKLYRTREHIEDFFQLYKGYVDGETVRVWESDRLRGRQFVLFCALGIIQFLKHKINLVKKNLEKRHEDKLYYKRRNLEIENKLLSWLKNTSFEGILNWFDCIELTRLTHGQRIIKVSTEMVSWERLFLKLLGYGLEADKAVGLS